MPGRSGGAMSAAAIRGKISAQLRRDLRAYAPVAAAWHRHYENCPVYGRVQAGASRACPTGLELTREARAAKQAVNVAGEDVVNILGHLAAERIACEELTASFRPVPG